MAKRKMKIDLNQIDNFAYALQTMKAEVLQRVRMVAEKWAEGTKSKYDSISGHVEIQGRRSFWSVNKSTYQEQGLYVSVGHANYIARFLEVGTKAHEIVHRQGRGYAVAKVRGIKGNKALSKAFAGRREALALEIEAAINKMLTEAN
ncbi:MAG: hypothetical protein MJ041_02515 [Acidaminococcaceae bacterium]|nr:hypothetical protein [Acidaminococcaceae bacterium]